MPVYTRPNGTNGSWRTPRRDTLTTSTSATLVSLGILSARLVICPNRGYLSVERAIAAKRLIAEQSNTYDIDFLLHVDRHSLGRAPGTASAEGRSLVYLDL